MAQKTFKIYTLGCKVNQYDSRYLGRLLNEQGYENTTQDAEVVIVNTCAVTQEAIAKDKKKIKKAKKENPRAKVILIGCWPQVYSASPENIGVDLVWGVGRLEDLVIYILSLFGEDQKVKKVEKMVQEERARYFLKIQDGCEQFCSYCIIPYTRGKLYSRPEQEVIEEAQSAIRAGFRELVLCGIHLGLYGKNEDSDLGRLLRRMVKIPEIGRIRLSSLEANEVTEGVLELMKHSSKICRHLHLPLQSGSDRILRVMNRPYTASDYEEKVKRIKSILPDISISTDVMVGFPGEEEEDFRASYEMAERLGFSRVHVFPFSAHEKTPAGQMRQELPGRVIRSRAKELRELGEKLENGFVNSFRGKELEVVVEGVSSSRFWGRSQYYFQVPFTEKDIVSYREQEATSAPEELVGRILSVQFQ